MFGTLWCDCCSCNVATLVRCRLTEDIPREERVLSVPRYGPRLSSVREHHITVGSRRLNFLLGSRRKGYPRHIFVLLDDLIIHFVHGPIYVSHQGINPSLPHIVGSCWGRFKAVCSSKLKVSTTSARSSTCRYQWGMWRRKICLPKHKEKRV